MFVERIMWSSWGARGAPIQRALRKTDFADRSFVKIKKQFLFGNQSVLVVIIILWWECWVYGVKICKPKINSQALGYCPDATCSPKELGPVNVRGYSCFISFQRNVLVSVPSTLLLNWLHLKVISTVTPFSIGVVTDNTEVGLTDLNDKYLILCFFSTLGWNGFFKM